jgi:hypothetical protein
VSGGERKRSGGDEILSDVQLKCLSLSRKLFTQCSSIAQVEQRERKVVLEHFDEFSSIVQLAAVKLLSSLFRRRRKVFRFKLDSLRSQLGWRETEKVFNLVSCALFSFLTMKFFFFASRIAAMERGECSHLVLKSTTFLASASSNANGEKSST